MTNIHESAGESSSLHPGSPSTPAAGSNSSHSMMDEIDREVAAAMAQMDAGDLAELSGGAVPSDSATEGAEMIGTVVGITDDDIFLEFGAKSQGVMPRTQFGKKEPIEIGRRVDVVVEGLDSESGMLKVNRKGAAIRATWTNIAVGTIVEGRVTGLIKGGLEVDLKGIRAFMPGSLADAVPMKDISVLLGQNIKAEVIELDRKSKNVLISRRKIMERELAENKDKLLAELEAGQTRKGIVGNITEFGAFVNLGGVDGLIHIRDVSWRPVEKVSDVLSPGQEVEVLVLKVDRKRERISLGLKQAQPDPWTGVENRFTVGQPMKVRVTRIADFGAFAELESGIEGLIPISEMGWSRVRAASDAVKPGDLVDAVIIRVEADKRRIALSMKQAQQDPWANVLDSYTPQSLVRGKVTRLADFGAFVELVPGVEGMVHISEMSDKRVRTCADVVSEGQEIEARVLGVDRENRRISLSIKQVAAPTASGPSHDDIAMAEAQKQHQAKKRKKQLRGGLSSHFDW